ncbi:unnamed protein product [Dibothriocephalus latus]|uniref:Uncharacterized protein n=1 Tax=Dibothriocephalus latus TaxID=60516 RepID=A0A3P7NU41_DIBLA|nr:unnamed protein product [Dibothriocephalus latus]
MSFSRPPFAFSRVRQEVRHNTGVREPTSDTNAAFSDTMRNVTQQYLLSGLNLAHDNRLCINTDGGARSSAGKTNTGKCQRGTLARHPTPAPPTRAMTIATLTLPSPSEEVTVRNPGQQDDDGAPGPPIKEERTRSQF